MKRAEKRKWNEWMKKLSRSKQLVSCVAATWKIWRSICNIWPVDKAKKSSYASKNRLRLLLCFHISRSPFSFSLIFLFNWLQSFSTLSLQSTFCIDPLSLVSQTLLPIVILSTAGVSISGPYTSTLSETQINASWSLKFWCVYQTNLKVSLFFSSSVSSLHN